MNLHIALLLAQDGVITGAIYALLAVAILLVFTVFYVRRTGSLRGAYE